MFCDKCGTRIDDSVRFCTKCGAETAVKMPGRRCTLCGSIVSARLHFCSFCGDDLTEQKAAASEQQTKVEKPRQTDPTPPAEPVPYNTETDSSEPEREIYRCPLVNYGKGMLSPPGTLIITNKAVIFNPISSLFASSRLFLPMNEIAGAQKTKTYGLVAGGLQICARDGRIFDFVLGSVREGDVDRIIILISQNTSN
ncbi:MAG: zinc ribbon domain-containing protein [Clostridiales bacterium]|nr:zinc ribbon domain-containing protein [Clostridiales bacterium]